MIAHDIDEKKINRQIHSLRKKRIIKAGDIISYERLGHVSQIETENQQLKLFIAAHFHTPSPDEFKEWLETGTPQPGDDDYNT